MDGGNIFCQQDHAHAHADAVSGLLGLSDERDAWLARIARESEASYLLGWEHGNRAGFERGARLLEATHPAIAAPLLGPSLAELELLRWGPGGRQRFGDPQPGDRYPTRVAVAA